MLKRLVLAGLVAGSSLPALAQTVPQGSPSAPMQGRFLTAPPAGAIALSRLKGTDVIGSDIVRIGEVEDVLVGADGRAAGVLIGVGGFLGMGGKTVAVPFEAMLWNYDVGPTDGPSSSNTGRGLQAQTASSNDPTSPGVNTVRPAESERSTVNNAGGVTAGSVDPARTGSVASNPSNPNAGAIGLGASSPGVGGTSAAGGVGPVTPMAQGSGTETAGRSGMEAAMGGAVPSTPATVQVTAGRRPERAVLHATREELRNAPAFAASR